MNVMIDLETRGFKPGCAILSIGAVVFVGSSLGQTFYRVINTKSCHDAGLTDDESTMTWWDGQSEAARKVIVEAENSETSLEAALNEFRMWLGRFGLKQVKVWGNGSDFDNAILACAYAAVKQEQPWPFWNNRCYRTVKSLYPQVKLQKRTGVYHNALDDAKTQAEHLGRIMKVGDLSL